MTEWAIIGRHPFTVLSGERIGKGIFGKNHVTQRLREVRVSFVKYSRYVVRDITEIGGAAAPAPRP
ncbi:hypothetical protein [Methylosinus sporium]|uniref:hypothetical protein n=1 Tax=Methylosinus sporium TaxID=428 RepID=UPI003839D569